MPDQKPQPKQLGHSSSQQFLGASSSLKSVGSKRLTASTSSLPAPQSVALYATPSYGSLYTEPEDLEPGPGTYSVPQGFGYQHLSTNMSQPTFSLTAKHDKSWSRIMITKDHLSALIARGSPGPGTYMPGFVESQARVRFGTGKRKPLADTNFRAPGPVYETRGAPDNPPKHIRFSKANRFDADNQSLSSALGTTGPGQYEVSTIFDGVNKARSFGASHRAYDRVRFPGTEKEGQGKTSPGPGSLQPFQNSGKSVSFGRAERLPGPGAAAKRAPGPGAYENHSKPNPDFKNQSVYSFGRPPARGRLDFKAMKALNGSMWGMN
eukprot:TRINITY_DN40625_c0_g1_i1.p1 TRINITY_DN40625_c0_g1~~TRINITY_DN40625_c0_g1_i1.p1  ORF type:complete len:322 (-),score=39.96 TRINITY_DN40625_c0_g1_i1:70-1035(-)